LKGWIGHRETIGGEDATILELRNVSKTFPGVKALDDVSVSFKAGEIHALLGENGAGKSTLIKILSGYQKPDKGSQILLNNQSYRVNSTREAFKSGIQTVYQELQVIPQASVAENIMLDKLSTRGKSGILNWRENNLVANTYLEKVGLNVDPSITINRLSIAQRQLVVIAKAIASDIKILLMDEPTASLTGEDAKNLFTVTDQLKRSGVLIIYVSHVLEEVLQIADKISILRDGQCVVSDDAVNMDRKKIIKYMIGREEDTTHFNAHNIDTSKKVLEAKNISKEKKASNISFALYHGEILGFYGLGYVTEDRRKDGLILSDNVKSNITITVWDRISNWFNYVSSKSYKEISTKIGNCISEFILIDFYFAAHGIKVDIVCLS
jgi:ribose transport system ATP-binding protein